MKRTRKPIELVYAGIRIGNNGQSYFLYLEYRDLKAKGIYLPEQLCSVPSVGTVITAHQVKGEIQGPYGLARRTLPSEIKMDWVTQDQIAKFTINPKEEKIVRNNNVPKLKRSKLPYEYGDLLRINNPLSRYKRKTYKYVRMENGLAVIFYKGDTEKSTFFLLVSPSKIYRKFKRKRR